MLRLLAAGAGLGAACVVYGIIEARLYRLRAHTIPVLPPGSSEIRVLQVSDVHLRLGNKRLAAFIESLSQDEYDLVLATGDLMGDPDSVHRCAEILNALRGSSGRHFVFGASDYYAPELRNYLDYFLGRRRHGTRRNPTDEFRRLLTEEGWNDLTNKTVATTLGGIATQITGLDDPYLRRDDRSLLERDPRARLALCVMHDPAPYADAARAGYDLIVAGHTHGGQVRMPFVGAVVTNSDLPRRLARWATRLDGSWLFVTPGLGTGKYGPFRFLCRPEASVLRLVPKR